MQYAVDIVFEAFDKTNATFEQIQERARKIEEFGKNVTAKGQSAGGPTAYADPNSVSALMDKFMVRLAGAAGIRGAVDAVTLGVRMWASAAGKLTDPLDKVFEKQAAIGDSVKDLVRDVPLVGSAIGRMMDAFGFNERPKELLRLFKEIENSIDRTRSQIESMSRGASQSMMESMGFPSSALEEGKIAQARQARDEELKAAKKAVEQAQEAYKLQRAAEDDRAGSITPGGGFGAPVIGGDHTVSDRIMKEEVQKAQETLRQRQAVEEQMRQAEDMRLDQMRQQEQEKANAEDNKQFEQGLKEQESSTLDHYRRLDEIRARSIENTTEREKQLIRIKYQYEIQQAREAGQNTSMLELMRDEELAGVKSRPGRLHQGGLEFNEVRYTGGNGPIWQQDMKSQASRQADFLGRLVRLQERMLNVIINNRGALGVSNFG